MNYDRAERLSHHIALLELEFLQFIRHLVSLVSRGLNSRGCITKETEFFQFNRRLVPLVTRGLNSRGLFTQIPEVIQFIRGLFPSLRGLDPK